MSLYKEMWLDNQLFEGSEEEFVAVKKFYKKEWYSNSKLHRYGGPAVIYSDGFQEWHQNGFLHRTDGPAVIRENGAVEYWQNGKRLIHQIDDLSGPKKEHAGKEEENRRKIREYELIMSIFRE